MEIILYKPEIAGNVGAIIRLAANTGIPLHIVESKTLLPIVYVNCLSGEKKS